MPHQGAYLGSVRSVEDLRGRCVCDAHTGCWHLRSASGRVSANGRPTRVWVHGHVESMSAPRAAYLLSRGKAPLKGMVAYRSCDSGDCANPEHIKATPRAVFTRMRQAVRPGEATVAQLQALRKGTAKHAVLTPELKAWLIESSQSHSDAAHGLGMSVSRVAEVRRKAVPSNVFILAGRAPRLMPASDRHAEVVA